jgi:hypothetical protein
VGLYTIVFEFRGGSFISQFSATNEVEALNKWANNPDEEMLSGIGFGGKRLTWISKVCAEIEDIDHKLVPLDGLKSVWHTLISINRSGGFMNIIETQHEKYKRAGSVSIASKLSKLDRKPNKKTRRAN